MKAPRGGGGNWNRAGRRSGGARPLRVPAPAPAVGPEIGPLCALERHALCSGWRCACVCHGRR